MEVPRGARRRRARARGGARRAEATISDARDMRPLPGRRQHGADAGDDSSNVVTLPGNAWCVIPATHAAFQSPEAADALVRALALALGLSNTREAPCRTCMFRM